MTLGLEQAPEAGGCANGHRGDWSQGWQGQRF